MADTVFLHIGTPKTATTYLQSVLTLNADRLARDGVLFPEEGRYADGRKHLLLHHNIAAARRTTYQLGQESRLRRSGLIGKERLAELEAGLRREVRESECDSAVVTCENFWKLENRQIARLIEVFSGFTVKIIVYLRRQDRLLDSMLTNLTLIGSVEKYKQKILDPSSEYRKLCDYYPILRKWESYVGIENMEVRAYDADRLVDNDIVVDFLGCVGVDVAEEYVRPARENESLSRVGVEIKAILNGLMMDMSRANRLVPSQRYIPFIARFMEGRECRRYSIWEEGQRADILLDYEKTNQKVGERYFGIGRHTPFNIDNPDIEPASGFPGLEAGLFGEFIGFMREADYDLYIELIGAIQNVGKERELIFGKEAGGRRGVRRSIIRMLGSLSG